MKGWTRLILLIKKRTDVLENKAICMHYDKNTTFQKTKVLTCTSLMTWKNIRKLLCSLRHHSSKTLRYLFLIFQFLLPVNETETWNTKKAKEVKTNFDIKMCLGNKFFISHFAGKYYPTCTHTLDKVTERELHKFERKLTRKVKIVSHR